MDLLLSRITIDPAICHGKPCVRGLRYPVDTLLELLSSGMTFDDVLADYPDLERDDLIAVLLYAVQRGLCLSDRARYLMASVADTPTTVRTGAELLAYWQAEGVIGGRPDISDSQAHARTTRELAERRT